MIDEGLPLCIASDFNPGSSPGGNMQFMMSLACTKMRLLPEEALAAITLNGAAALGMSHEIGSIEPGKRADFCSHYGPDGKPRGPTLLLLPRSG